MVVYCAVYGCTSSYHDKGRRFFRFPKDVERSKKWLQACDRSDLERKNTEMLNRSYFICDLHFKPDDMLAKRLKQCVNPTLNLPFTLNQISVSTQTEQLTGKEDSMVDTEEVTPIDFCQIEYSKKSYATRQSDLLSPPSTSRKLEKITRLRSASRKENKDSSQTIETESDDQGYIEQGLSHEKLCNICNDEIYGFRYKCVQCESFDMCVACEGRREHATHYVLRIPSPRPEEEVTEMLQRVRQVIQDLAPDSPKPEDPAPVEAEDDEAPVIVKMEMGEEVPDPLNITETEPYSVPHESNIMEHSVLDIEVKQEPVTTDGRAIVNEQTIEGDPAFSDHSKRTEQTGSKKVRASNKRPASNTTPEKHDNVPEDKIKSAESSESGADSFQVFTHTPAPPDIGDATAPLKADKSAKKLKKS